MKAACICLGLLAAALRAQAAVFWVAPQPAPGPAALSGSAAARSGPRIFLAPFKDVRRQRDLWKGTSNLDSIRVSAQDLSLQAGAWGSWDYSDTSFLWHRQLGQTLVAAGFTLAAAVGPQPAKEAQTAAGLSGCAYILDGALKRLDIGKRGSDEFVGTNFSGTNYTFILEARLQVRGLSASAAVLSKDLVFKHVYHDPTSMGSQDRDTFPRYFLAGLEAAAQNLSEDKDLRVLAGLPALAPTPTAAPTPPPVPVATAPAQLTPAPAPSPTATPTDLDQGPYWVNPKTGKRVDPAWNFDPMDGTPRKDFVLRQTSAPKGTPAAAPGN
jgi:hypothetical protein